MRFQSMLVFALSLSGLSANAKVCDYGVVKVNHGDLVANLLPPKGQ